jgi:hypothetical protein
MRYLIAAFAAVMVAVGSLFAWGQAAETWSAFVTAAPSLPLPYVGTDTIPVVRSNTTFHSPLTSVLGLPYTATNATLKALTGGSFSIIVRDGFAAAGDGGAATYTWNAASTCTDDGGSCIQPNVGTGRWILANLAPYNSMIWGVTANPLTLYVRSSGSDTANYCMASGTPCATFQRAVNICQQLDMQGGNCLVTNTDVAPWSDAESISVTNPLRGAGNGTAVPNIGTRWASQIVIDGNNQVTITGAAGACYGIAASNNAIVGVRRINVAPTFAACQDGLFAQLGGGINVFDGVTLGATGANGCKAHAENSAYGIQFWENYTLTGNGSCGYSAGGGASTIIIGAGVGTISGNPTIAELVFVSSGGTFQTNIANPWGAIPGAMTGAGFLASPGGTIEANGLAVAWPGTATSYLQGGAYDQPPAPTASSDANIGTTGTVAMLAGSTPYQGAVVMTAGGAAIGSAGNVTVTFPSPISVRRQNGGTMQCGAGLLTSGSGTWANGARVSGTNVSAGAISFNWNNFAVGLVAGSTYAFWYNCKPA